MTWAVASGGVCPPCRPPDTATSWWCRPAGWRSWGASRVGTSSGTWRPSTARGETRTHLRLMYCSCFFTGGWDLSEASAPLEGDSPLWRFRLRDSGKCQLKLERSDGCTKSYLNISISRCWEKRKYKLSDCTVRTAQNITFYTSKLIPSKIKPTLYFCYFPLNITNLCIFYQMKYFKHKKGRTGKNIFTSKNNMQIRFQFLQPKGERSIICNFRHKSFSQCSSMPKPEEILFLKLKFVAQFSDSFQIF